MLQRQQKNTDTLLLEIVIIIAILLSDFHFLVQEPSLYKIPTYHRATERALREFSQENSPKVSTS